MSVIYENGQVVIPKHLRKRFNLTSGSRVRFREQCGNLIIEPEYDVVAEFERLCSMGTSTFEQTEKKIKEVEEKRKREILNVP